ncbi:MAG: MBL fold metallo-hydrolase [Candidatus Aenigmarchaeota archaeon]|nr:MBL fold metallo-hydrolase [Candidatus Aenigmarchaeota archaeon]
MVTIKFLGGVNEIGGNKILIEDKANDARVMLDFGMNFTRHGMFFEEFIQPRTSNGITDYLQMGVLPWMEGIYRPDLLEFAGRKAHSDQAIDAIVLSHAHLDHAAHISFIDGAIPVYCSQVTHAILKALHETQPRSLGNEILDYRKRPALDYKDRPIARKFNIVKGRFKVNGLEIELIPVDHSIPGACGMLIYGSDRTVAYSGDLRLHGTDGHLTQEFVERLRIEKPDVFMCEGTRIDETENRNEAYVKVNCDQAISQAKGLVIADFAFKDTTRFKTFLEIARSTGRKLCIPFKDAYYIRALAELVPGLPSLKDDSILLYQKRRMSGTFRASDYQSWEREFLDKGNTATAEAVGRMQEQAIAALGYFDVPELIDIKPQPGSVYIKSASEAFNEEQQFDLERLKRWLAHFGIRYENYHASGHAPGPDLAQVMNNSNAKVIMPIHTEKPELFQGMAGNARVELPILTK